MSRLEPLMCWRRKKGWLSILKSTSVLAITVLALFCSSCGKQPQADAAIKAWLDERAAATPLTPAEQQFRSNMLLEDVKRVVYRDETGADIPYNTFASVVADGSRSFRRKVEADKSVAVVSINPAGTAPSIEQLASEPLGIAIGSAMPPLGNADTSGKQHELDNGKHHTLLFFYVADCMPCIHEVPQLNALRGRTAIELVSVTVDDKAAARRIVTERGLRLPVVADARAYVDALGLKTYPTLVLVSPRGRLMGARTAYQTGKTREESLEHLEDWLASLGVQI